MKFSSPRAARSRGQRCSTSPCTGARPASRPRQWRHPPRYRAPNILRTHEGVVKLTDFRCQGFRRRGTSRPRGRGQHREFLCLPNRHPGKPVNKRSDLYSLGVVLYTLPQPGKDPLLRLFRILDLLHKHRYGQFDPPHARINPKIPFEVDELVCSLLEKDPDKKATGLPHPRQAPTVSAAS